MRSTSRCRPTSVATDFSSTAMDRRSPMVRQQLRMSTNGLCPRAGGTYLCHVVLIWSSTPSVAFTGSCTDRLHCQQPVKPHLAVLGSVGTRLHCTASHLAYG